MLLDEDGTFYIVGSNGASNTVFELARMSSDGTELVTMEAWEMDGYILTHSSQNGVNVISEREFEIATDRFYNITTEFVDSFNWQPLSATVNNEAQGKSNTVGVNANGITETINQVLFCGIPVQNICQMTKDEVISFWIHGKFREILIQCSEPESKL